MPMVGIPVAVKKPEDGFVRCAPVVPQDRRITRVMVFAQERVSRRRQLIDHKEGTGPKSRMHFTRLQPGALQATAQNGVGRLKTGGEFTEHITRLSFG